MSRSVDLPIPAPDAARPTANPKGQLWEACAQRKLSPPSIRHAASGDRHRVQMRLDHGDWELDSDVHWAASRKAAEQLAAQALLDELAALELDEPALRPPPPSARAEAALGDDDVFEVDAADVDRHRLSNPKGQVYEWCQKQKPPVRRPRFEVRTLPGAVAARGRLDTLDVQTPWFRATRRSEAEQAAAEVLLGLLPVAGDEAAIEAPLLETAHPRTVLDQLLKAGELLECSVEIVEERGLAHERVFVAQGFVVMPDGREVCVEAVEGSTRRGALRRASQELLISQALRFLDA